MILFSAHGMTLSINEDAIDMVLYEKATAFFKASGFYMKSNFILPYHFIEGEVVLEAVGVIGRLYQLKVGDLTYEFQGSTSVSLPANQLMGKVMDIEVYDQEKLLGGAGVAFAYYAVFVYAFVYNMIEFAKRLDQYKYGRYLLANEFYSDLLEAHFGKMSGFMRELPWTTEEYRLNLMQWVDSFLKYPAIKRGFVQMVNLLGYKDWINAKLEAWAVTPGYTHLPTIDKWVSEKYLL